MKNLIAGLIDGKSAFLKTDEIKREECIIYAYRDDEIIGIFPEHSLAYLYLTEEKERNEN